MHYVNALFYKVLKYNYYELKRSMTPQIIFLTSNKIMNIIIHSLKIQFRQNLNLKRQNKIMLICVIDLLVSV